LKPCRRRKKRADVEVTRKIYKKMTFPESLTDSEF